MNEQRRAIALDLVQAALGAADAGRAVHTALQRQGDQLCLGDQLIELPRGGARLRVVGAGKAAPAMARAVEELLGEVAGDGIVVAKRGLVAGPLPRWIEVVEGGHPLPDAAGVAAAARLVERLRDLGPRDLVLCLLSGGGSSLLTLPAEGLVLEDLQQVADLLLAAGAPIQELNVVRKHLGRLGGGQLAALAAPARVVSLVLSDVVGDDLGTIASGPTAPDASTFADALGILEQRGLRAQAPARVLARLEAGVAGRLPETPKSNDPCFDRVQSQIVGSGELAALAVQRRADELGFRAAVLSTTVEGEAREVGKVLAAVLREMALRGRPLGRPACLIAGGETTVTLGTAPGRGGRNQELALAAALGLQGLEEVLLVALATDGNDGVTDAAGALVDGSTVVRGTAAGLSAAGHLQAHDAYPYFAALGDLLITGPSGTNVNDLTLLLAF